MERTPTTIGRFKVLSELGRGGMGVVYLAEDPLLKRGVAIKLVHGGPTAQQEALARFRQEAEISASLNHPNVITIFDVGEEEGLGPFMAMEYVEGEVLSTTLARGTMEPKRVALLLIQGLHALEAAHGLGIVHRDFKPANLIIGKGERLKLMDFGIASDEFSGMTTSGILCTPSFAAPEILSRKPPSPATDAWAFTVTAFLMVTGQLPFQAEHIGGTLFAVAYEPPTFPADLSPTLKAVFSRALEKAPEARYPSLRAFMTDLLDALSLDRDAVMHCRMLLEMSPLPAEDVSLDSSSPWWIDWRTWLKPPRVLWAAGLLVLALFLILLVSGRLVPRRITLASYPPGAKVFVEDRLIGTTPLTEARIPSRARTLRLEKEGYQSLERVIRPEDRRLALSLMANPIVLNLQTDPPGAEVFVNGVLMGTTPIKGLQIAGDRSHHLQIRKTGFESWFASASKDHLPPEFIPLRVQDRRFFRRQDKRPLPRQDKLPFWKKLFG